MAGMTLPLVTSAAGDGAVDMAQMLQLSAQKAGLNLDIKRMPADGYWANHWAKHPLSFGSINARPTADLIFTPFYARSTAVSRTTSRGPMPSCTALRPAARRCCLSSIE
jgi:peptide/nickel transport system substrate-binding protein